MDSKRIGTQAAGVSPAAWPEFNMDGQRYERPADTLNIPGGKFVVLPCPHRDSDIERLKAMLATASDEPFRSANEQIAVEKTRGK